MRLLLRSAAALAAAVPFVLAPVAAIGVGAVPPGARAEAAVGAVTVSRGLGGIEYYARPIRRPDGHIDVARTIAGVKGHGGTSYGYLLYPKAGHDSAREWTDLPVFLTAAAKAGIAVELFLTPPSSTSSAGHKCSGNRLTPYGGRYDVWMARIGDLARARPALVSVSMDDFGYNVWGEPRSRCKTFPPGTITRWNKILTAHAGRPLKARPVLYLADLTGSRRVYPTIKGEAPELIWPFYGWVSPKGSMRAQYASIRRAFPKAKVTVMIYTTTYRGVTPTKAMIASDTAAARRLGLPVVFYQKDLTKP